MRQLREPLTEALTEAPIQTQGSANTLNIRRRGGVASHQRSRVTRNNIKQAEHKKTNPKKDGTSGQQAPQNRVDQH